MEVQPSSSTAPVAATNNPGNKKPEQAQVNELKGALKPDNPCYVAEKHKKMKGVGLNLIKYCSLKHKIANIAENGTYKCTNCQKTLAYYREGEEINLLK